MQRSSRRQFFGRTLAAGAGATLVQPFVAAAPADEPPRVTPAQARGKDPNFLMGQVVDVGSDRSLTVVDLDDQLRHAKFKPATQVWKASTWNQHQIVAKDCVMGRGEFDGDAVLVLDNVYANILNFRGVVQVVDGKVKKVKLAGEDNRPYEFTVKADTIVHDVSGTVFDGDPSKVKAGDDLVVIAFRDTTTGDLVAHRMEASEAFGQGAVSPEPSPVAGTMHTRRTPTAGSRAGGSCRHPLPDRATRKRELVLLRQRQRLRAVRKLRRGLLLRLPERRPAHGVAARLVLHRALRGLLPPRRLPSVRLRHALLLRKRLLGLDDHRDDQGLRSQPALPQHGLSELRLRPLRPDAMRV